jgi:hypothetical protein
LERWVGRIVIGGRKKHHPTGIPIEHVS